MFVMVSDFGVLHGYLYNHTQKNMIISIIIYIYHIYVIYDVISINQNI